MSNTKKIGISENLLLEVISLDTNNKVIEKMIHEGEELKYGKSL